MPGQDRLLGPGRQLQCDETGMDARNWWLPECRRHLYRMHDAGLPRQIHAVYGRTSRRVVLIRQRDRLWTHDHRLAQRHQPYRQQRTKVAPSRHKAHYRIRTCNARREETLMTTMITTKKSVLPQTEGLVEMNWDPITRIVGSLGIFTKIDFKNRQVAECYSTSSIFRGYSVFMKNKDPRDAHFITSRICGICGDNHATCAVYAQNMAFGIKTPPLGEWIINLGEAAEYMFDHNIFQDNLVGVDFCEQMIKETNPGVWDKAQRKAAPHAEVHGYRTIADIMTALNPFTGEFYRETLAVSRNTR